MKAFLIDLTKCVGCHDCQIGCKDEHCGNNWMPYAQPQPDTGQFWIKVNQTERGAGSHVRVSYMPVLCNHCDNPSCMNACSAGAITKRDDGLVLIDPAKCTGCKDCIEACPYNVVYFNDELEIAQKCTGCAHLIDRGWPISVPRCMDNCHVDVILFGEESDLDLEGTEVLHPEYGTKPRVFYRGLPKKFIAATVYDPDTEEIVEGAKVTLEGPEGSFETTTDSWGDFWFKDLPDGEWTLQVEQGGKMQNMAVSTLEKDQGLADIALA